VGKPKEREILLASGKLYQHQNYIFQQEKSTYNTQKLPPQILPWKTCESIPLYGSPKKQYLGKRANSLLYGLICAALLQQENPQNNVEICASYASKFMPSFPCCTHCTDPYSTVFNRKNISAHSQKFDLGNVPNLAWEKRSTSCPFLFQALSEISLNIFFSLCLAHYPMHSLIIRK
jgi:hypothetical protein